MIAMALSVAGFASSKKITEEGKGRKVNSVYQGISVRGMRFIFLFISLFAQRNEPKKGPPVSLSRRRRDALCSLMLPGLCKLGFASNSAKPFFGSLSGARLRPMGF